MYYQPLGKNKLHCTLGLILLDLSAPMGLHVACWVQLPSAGACIDTRCSLSSHVFQCCSYTDDRFLCTQICQLWLIRSVRVVVGVQSVAGKICCTCPQIDWSDDKGGFVGWVLCRCVHSMCCGLLTSHHNPAHRVVPL